MSVKLQIRDLTAREHWPAASIVEAIELSSACDACLPDTLQKQVTGGWRQAGP